MREGKDIFHRNSIDLSIIEYGAIAPVLLSDVEDRCQVWGFQFSDQTSVFLLLDVFLLELFLSVG
jgi:hypothetical protein